MSCLHSIAVKIALQFGIFLFLLLLSDQALYLSLTPLQMSVFQFFLLSNFVILILYSCSIGNSVLVRLKKFTEVFSYSSIHEIFKPRYHESNQPNIQISVP
jgi:hypothetical protein